MPDANADMCLSLPRPDEHASDFSRQSFVPVRFRKLKLPLCTAWTRTITRFEVRGSNFACTDVERPTEPPRATQGDKDNRNYWNRAADTAGASKSDLTRKSPNLRETAKDFGRRTAKSVLDLETHWSEMSAILATWTKRPPNRPVTYLTTRLTPKLLRPLELL